MKEGKRVVLLTFVLCLVLYLRHSYDDFILRISGYRRLPVIMARPSWARLSAILKHDTSYPTHQRQLQALWNLGNLSIPAFERAYHRARSHRDVSPLAGAYRGVYRGLVVVPGPILLAWSLVHGQLELVIRGSRINKQMIDACVSSGLTSRAPPPPPPPPPHPPVIAIACKGQTRSCWVQKVRPAPPPHKRKEEARNSLGPTTNAVAKLDDLIADPPIDLLWCSYPSSQRQPRVATDLIPRQGTFNTLKAR